MKIALMIMPVAALALVCSATMSVAKAPSPSPSDSSPSRNSRSRFKVQLFPPLMAMQAKMDTSQDKRPIRLKMEISRNEKRPVEQAPRFPPLPKFLQAGNTWDEDKVVDPTADGENIWYKVPAWIAGEYSYGPMTVYQEQDLQKHTTTSGNLKFPGLPSGRQRGILRDKAGAIWQRAYGGGITDPTKSYGDVYPEKFDDELTGSIISPNQYTEHSAGIVFEIRKSTNKIVNVQRWERVRDFSFKNGTVNVNLAETRYDTSGKPLMVSKSRGTMVKRESFVPLAPGGMNQIAGSYEHAVRSLRGYLKASGQSLQNLPKISE